MELSEAVRLAVSQSPVLRSVGGTVVQAPQGAATVYDPAMSYANPLGGVEAALADFDAQVTGALNWAHNEFPNNVQTGGLGAAFNPPAFRQKASNFNSEISKQTAQGGRFALRHIVSYDRNNRPFREFPSDFTGWVEAEWRQPLMQGAGTTFNRIAGPNSAIGQYNGVLIARINNDISLADFEAAVITLVSDVEQTYWQLYGAYRDLEIQLRARESALRMYQFREAWTRAELGPKKDLPQAESEYHLFASQVENALAGPNGVYVLEQRLRYLLGMPATDGSLIKPITEPQSVRVVFDWQSALDQSLTRRVEIRRQQWGVKRRELELVAARLNRRPRLDFLGTYRWRGLGDHLIGPETGQLDNLYGSIATGDFQEWTAGMELSMPVGLRRASVAVSHAQLNLARERALLSETELRVSHDLANAAREVSRAYQLMQTNVNRMLADQRQLKILFEITDLDANNQFELLQVQRQSIGSESDFYRALVDYNLAIRDLHRQKGSLLAYNQVQLAEGPWAAKASNDAHEMGRFFTPRLQPGKVSQPQPVSRGSFDPSAPVSTQGYLPMESELIESPPEVIVAPSN
jgi:outer membrane protein TolC